MDIIYDQLVAIPGFTCVKPQGAFYLYPNVKQAAEIAGFTSVDAFVEALLVEAKVAVVPGSGFGTPDNIRLSYATSLDQLEKAVQRMDQFMKERL